MIYQKFKNIFDTLEINKTTYLKVEIVLNLFNANKSSTNKDCFIMLYRQKINELKTEGYSIWATDASIMGNLTGCAVCNISCNQNFLFSISTKVSSLTGELHAIDKAIDIIIEDGYDKAAVFTDSKNACFLLSNNTANNYLVNNILNKIHNSLISKLTFIWTPSHIGIAPNELADYYAKYATTSGCSISTAPSIKDAQNLIIESLWEEWRSEYKEISKTKGTYFQQFCHEPKIQFNSKH